MESVQIIEKNNIKIVMRKEFFHKFKHLCQQLEDNYQISYFSTNIIQNYYQPGHRVSTFGMKEEWSELYWERYWNQDPVEQYCHSITLKNNSSISIWNAVDEESECAQQRAKICQSTNGFLIAFQHNHRILENISFGWEKLTDETFDLKKINQLNQLIKPLRQYHLMTHELYD